MLLIQIYSKILTEKEATTSDDHLFKVYYERNKQYPLEDQAQTLHTIMPQLIFMTTRAHQDTQKPAEFLATRVKDPYDGHTI